MKKKKKWKFCMRVKYLKKDGIILWWTGNWCLVYPLQNKDDEKHAKLFNGFAFSFGIFNLDAGFGDFPFLNAKCGWVR